MYSAERDLILNDTSYFQAQFSVFPVEALIVRWVCAAAATVIAVDRSSAHTVSLRVKQALFFLLLFVYLNHCAGGDPVTVANRHDHFSRWVNANEWERVRLI